MRRDSDGFNLDDMLGILGESAPGSIRRLPAEPDAALTTEEQALLSDYEDARRRRLLEEQAQLIREQLAVREQEARRIIEEYERQAAGTAAAPPSAPPEQNTAALADIGVAENAALCALLEGSRMVMVSYLAPRIGSKNAISMLAKSFERARAKAPFVLRDANWRPDGSLREDGSVDAERLMRNAAALPPETRVADYLAGLRELVDLRLKAVEAGLGADVSKDLGARLMATREDPANRRVPAPWLAAFYERVLA